MRRGDIVTVAAAGDYGKPRPAVVVQSNSLPSAHPSVVVCQMTTELIDAIHIRLTIEPAGGNGLHVTSQIMVDKPIAVRRHRIGRVVGRLDDHDMSRLDVALAVVMGLMD